MSGESSTPPGAVFLSYASQDAEAAKRICEALRSAGIEVWFDQSALRGGEAWDRRIRREIRDCVLFVPVISANAHARTEGYFRLEWKLAVDRSHLMAPDQTFLLPVSIDHTPQADERIPDRFRELQWTRLLGGDVTAEFVARIQRLLTPEVTTAQAPPAPAPAPRAISGSAGASARTPRGAKIGWAVGLLALVAVVALFVVERVRIPKPVPSTSMASAPAVAVVPAARSIAVLPFVNLSSDKEQEYFADGLAEELLGLLAKTPGLHVVARTSSFSFKGKSDDIPTIASKLNVAHILEGSVRKSSNRLRVTTELVRAADGEQIWSETYDRELKDIFKVQDEIASAVVGALKLRLAPDQGSLSSRSKNTEAYLQYLLGRQYFSQDTDDDYRRSVTAYRQAIELDPNYAAAYAGLSLSENYLASITLESAGVDRARAAAERAIMLAPNQPMGYAARADLRVTYFWDWAGAQADIAKAVELGPTDPFVLRRYANILQALGQLPEAIAIARKITDLDPYSDGAWRTLSEALYGNGDLGASRQAILHAQAINPGNRYALVDLGSIELLDRRPEAALAAFGRMGTEAENTGWRLTGIAMAEHSLGHARESQQALDEAIAKSAQQSAYQIAETYAWIGDKEQAFAWLERAYRQRDAGLAQQIKTDPLLASIKGDARYAAMLKKIHLQ